jgi:acyl-CoA hydrolase
VDAKGKLTMFCANPNAPYQLFTDEALAGHLRAVALFLTASVRKHQGHGVLTHMPRHLSAWAKTIQARSPSGIDVFWGSCTPPDANGFVSLGPSAVYEVDALRAAKKVVLEVNPSLPLCHGAPRIPLREVDILVHGAPTPPLSLPEPQFDEVDRKVAENVAALIPVSLKVGKGAGRASWIIFYNHHESPTFHSPLVTQDGATIQFGIGGIPNALGEALANHKDLGIHTEMINDAMLQLIEKGARRTPTCGG